ncbi:MAG: hypothetical protein WCV91_01920 [Candidatus Margulisiibacteriota bacterium]
MKKWLIFLTLISLLAGFSIAAAKWKTFNGAFFDISYPATFKAIPSLKSGYMPEKYDSARFISPDKQVEFYVLAPMWNADAAEIAVNPKTEKVVSEREEEGRLDFSGIIETIKQVTIKAKDGSYLRSYIDTEGDNNTRLIFGIKYRNMKAYESYKADYLQFKKSIRQYSD